MNFYEANGMVVKDKSPSTGAALGLLPGGGSFYTGNIGTGVINLLLWPTSILWDPFNGYYASEEDNYMATRVYITRKENDAMNNLEDQLSLNTITKRQYMLKKNEIRQKYDPYSADYF